MDEQEQVGSGGAAASGGQQEPATGQQQQQQFATLDEVKRLVTDVMRQSQSLTDKAESRVSKQVQERLAKLQEDVKKLVASGTDVPESVMRNLEEAYDQTQNASHNNDIRPYVQRQVADIFKRVGVEINAGDPEFATVEADSSVPAWRFLATLEAAAKAKSERVKNASNAPTTAQGEQTAPQPNLARVPSAGAGSSVRTGGDLMAEYRKEIAAAPTGSEQALQIRRKYRSKGLAI